MVPSLNPPDGLSDSSAPSEKIEYRRLFSQMIVKSFSVDAAVCSVLRLVAAAVVL